MVWPPPRIQATPEGEAAGAVQARESPNAPVGQREAIRPSLHEWLSHPETLIGSVLGGRYRVTSLLGRGPMGIACEGESSRGRQVTLKLLPRPPQLPVEHFAWQVRQTLALAHFDHPHVSPINDFGALEDGSAFVSRSRVPAASLRELLRQGALPVRRALELGRQIATALAAAHAQDIAHGRLKPENVLVQTQAAGADLVKVVDFGMAELPVNTQAVTPDENEARRLWLRARLYLPPAAGAAANPAADVYSLGVMLFEMIAGQPPFDLEALGVLGHEPAPKTFAQCHVQVPGAISDLVMSMLAPRAAQHGVSAGHLVQVLDALLGRPSSISPPEPVTSQRPSAPPNPGFAASAPQPAPASPPMGQGPSGGLSAPGAGGGGGLVPSWPPLPQGFSASSVPPPPSHDALQGTSREGVARGSFPPVVHSAEGTPNAWNGSLPSGADASPATAPGPYASDDDVDTDFRPSLLARLRRLFQRKSSDGF